MILLIYLAIYTRISNNAGDDNMWFVIFSFSTVKKEEVFCLSEFIFDTKPFRVLIALNGLFR